jgi:hypothetical protein
MTIESIINYYKEQLIKSDCKHDKSVLTALIEKYERRYDEVKEIVKRYECSEEEADKATQYFYKEKELLKKHSDITIFEHLDSILELLEKN